MKKQVVSFSGGRTSAYLCYLIKGMYQYAEFVYMDTGAEHPKTYDFIRKCNDYFDLNLTCLRVDINPVLGKGNSYKIVNIEDIGLDLIPFSHMTEKYSTPTVTMAFCTDRMKTTPFLKYCNDKYGKGGFNTWLGMRIDEPRRLKMITANRQSIIDTEKKPSNPQGIRYLAEISDFEKQDILDWWSNMPFDLEIEEHLGNCVFCVKKSLNKLALAARDEPVLAQQFMDMIASDKVRIMPTPDNIDGTKSFKGRSCGVEIMYRGNNSLQSIIDMYADKSRDEITSTIRGMKSLDSGSCSESCEAFNPDQLDIFD